MNNRTLQQTIGLMLVVLLLVGCGEQSATPSPEPLLGLKVNYDYSGRFGVFGIADKAKAYDENGILVGEAQCLDIEKIPDAKVGANLIVEETQYARDGSGTIVYEGKIVFNTQTGQVTSEEMIQGSKHYNIFQGWPMGR
jgi:hypothetical protein